jgi:outer membrane receptor protein involved in Fe transport
MTRTGYWRGFVRLSISALLCVALFMPALPAFSAEAAAEEDEDSEAVELEEVKVTGTRIQLPNVTSANPITSITAEEMRNLGIVNVADALTQLVPQNMSTYQPGLTGDIQSSGAAELGFLVSSGNSGGGGTRELDRGSFFIGSTIANLRGMDPAFGSRTLTLIDGRRTVSSSSQADVVDMNIIPSNLLQRMDVVTGGASATYGSGAMAGVVNLVLNNRLQGINLDMDYGVNEAGDGSSPHISLSGGTQMFGGKAHILFGAEWQDTRAIQDCAAARSWCAESRTMFTNSEGSLADPAGVLTPLRGYEGLPARFQMENVRFNQFSPYGAIYENNTSTDPNSPPPTSGYAFTADGMGIEPFAYGFRGARNLSSTMNGDGPLVTTDTVLRPESERKSFFTNFEFDFSESTTAYIQASYAMTDAENRNRYTTGTSCVRFDNRGVAAVPGAKVNKGQVIQFGSIGETHFVNGIATPKTPDAYWNNEAFRNFVGVGFTGTGGLTASANTPNNGATTRRGPPWMISFTLPSGQNSATTTTAGGSFGSNINTPPNFPFSSNVSAQGWRLVRTGNATTGSMYWNLDYIVISSTAGDPSGQVALDDPGIPAVLPTLGRNAYAFLNQLSPEALNQVQRANNRSPGTGTSNAATSALWGTNPCTGFTAIKKVWNPQVQQYTTQDSDTWRAVAGVRGRFGQDWKWEGYYQYGATDSVSTQFNGATNLSFNFAMDAVLDDRIGSSTYGQPVCRITRDGVPVLDTTGLPMSDAEGLRQLAADCKPLNIFGAASPGWSGLDMTTAELQALQGQALEYAFKDSSSAGSTSLQTLSFNTSGTLWQGWGAGPLTGAVGVELSENKVDNQGTRGSFYLRSDLAAWQDSFGGKTRSTEGFTELNMPVVSGVEGLNLFSVNVAGRYTSYYNKGGVGTTGEDATQNTFNWKASAVVEPFDFLRLRLTRSRDMRAAGYRDLFLNQVSLPDQSSGTNFWREATEVSDENRTERFGYVRVGNPNLKPEKSDTLTMGVVLSPGGWAQGMRVTADYSDIRVRDAIYTPFAFNSARAVIQQCWENSGNSDDPDNPRFGQQLFDPSRPECQEITFGVNPDGSRNLQDVIYVNSTRPQNGLPYRQRGIDVSVGYNFPLSRAFDGLPGSMSLTVRGTRALEASGIQQTTVNECQGSGLVSVDGIFRCADRLVPIDLVGQIRSNQFVPGIQATPNWRGSLTATYLLGNLTTSLSARYISGAYMDKTWTDDPTSPAYRNAAGQLLNAAVDDNWVDQYFNFSLNGSYNLKVANMKQFQVFGSINNLFDKSPPFTGGGISGATAGFHDTFGRAYRMGLRLRF